MNACSLGFAACFAHWSLLRALQLVDKSADLSMASQLFYKQARKANSCCRFM
jgi:amino acid permease